MLLLSFVSTLKSQMVGCGEYHRDTTGWAQHLSQSRFPENYYMDRFGNKFTYEEIQMPPPMGGECDCFPGTSYFHLVFEDCSFNTGFGFDDQTFGEDRRNALCRVFKYIASVIVQNPGHCGVTNMVNIRIQPSGEVNIPGNSDVDAHMPAMQTGIGGTGSNIFQTDRKIGIVDNLAWIVINTGVSPVPLTGQYSYHGALRFNFQNLGTNPDNGQPLSFHIDENSSLGTNEIDFFHVALHEALHMLGIGTYITPLPDNEWGSFVSNDIVGGYSRWDRYLKKESVDIPLIENPDMMHYNWMVNSALSLPTDFTESCEAGDVDIVFKDQTGGSYPIYTGTSFNSASTLSHLAGYCNGVDANYTIDGAGVIIGDPDPPRTYHSHELKILKALGYRINTKVGNDGITVAGNVCSVGGVDDYRAGCDGPIFEMEACPGDILVIHYADIVQNDVNVQSIEGVELTDPYGSISLTSGGQPDITFTPYPGLPHNYTIRYIPLGCGGEEGNITYIHIKVQNCLSLCSFTDLSAAQETNPDIVTPSADCQSNCVSCGYNNNPCNLICNPEFCSNAPDNVTGVQSPDFPIEWQMPGWGTAIATPEYYTHYNTISGNFNNSGHALLGYDPDGNEGVFTPIVVFQGETYFFSIYRRSFTTLNAWANGSVDYFVRLASNDTRSNFGSDMNSTLSEAFPMGYEDHSYNVITENGVISNSYSQGLMDFTRKGAVFNIPINASDEYTALWINTSGGTDIGGRYLDIDQPELIPDDFSAGESATIQCGSGQSVTLGGRDFCMLSDVKVQYTWTNENTGMVIANYTVVRGINGMETIMDLSTMSILTDIPDFSVSPLVTTTYRLHRELIPDADGSLGGIAPSELAGIIQDDEVTVTVINELGNPDFTYEAQCNAVTFTTSSTSPGYSHSWDFGDGQSSTEANPTHMYMNLQTYTVTHTVSNICGTVSSTQTIDITCINACSCPEGVVSYTVGETGLLEDNPLSMSNLPQSGVSGACITINGNFVIDTPSYYSFNHCMIYMAPGSSITLVTPNVSFNETIIQGCERMWRSIYMQEGKTLTISASKIYDAQYAITTADKSHLYLKFNQFIRNYAGIYNPNTSLTLDVRMIGNEFHCLNETLLPSYDALNPPASHHTYAGVLIDKLSAANFGITGQISNVFHDINNGFVSKKAGYGVYYCRFYNILHSDEYPISGCGINAVGAGESSIVVSGTGIAPVSPDLPSFDNCTNGIFAKKLGVVIRNNRMLNVERGINIVLGGDHNIGIADNQIECDLFGIKLSQCDAATDLQITNNYICVDSFAYEDPSGGEGIVLEDGNVPHPAATVNNNYVNVWQTNNGITLECSNKVIVDDNIVHMNNANVNLAGIQLKGSTDCNIFCNHVESPNPNIGGATLNNGLSVSMTGNTTYQNNTFVRNWYGAHFGGECPNTKLITNTFDRNNFGLGIAVGGKIGPQPANPGDPLNGNIWITTPSQPQTKALWAGEPDPNIVILNLIIYNQGISNTKPSLFNPSNWFNNSTNPTNVPDPDLCDPYQIPEEEINSQDLVIASDENSTSNIEETMDNIAKRYLFRKLDENPELIFSSQLLETFWEEAGDGTIGKLYNIDKDKAVLFDLEVLLREEISNNEEAIKNYLASIEAIDAGLPENPGVAELTNATAQKTALYQLLQEKVLDQKVLHDQIKSDRDPASDGVADNNEVISTTEVFETNEKIVNQIYLETIAKGIADFTLEQLSQLEYIASQCPLTGGIAVYMARSLLSLVADYHYDDENLCSEPLSLMAYQKGRSYTDAQSDGGRFDQSGGNVSDHFTLFPNPSKDQVSCMYTTGNDLTLTVSDIIGNFIWTTEITKGIGTFEIPVKGFPDGSYLFLIRDAREKIIYREKIVVLHK